MKKIPVTEAIGHTLCHDMTAIMEGGFKGVRFHRNHVITEEDIPVLQDMGKNHVFVWEPGVEEVHEEDCARQMAELLCPEGAPFTLKGPAEGKMSLHASCDGLLRVNRDGLLAVNLVPDWTMTSLPDGRPVAEGEACAAWRIIPLVTRRENVHKALECVREASWLFQLLPYQHLRVGLIITGNEIYHGRIRDAFEPILRSKLEHFPSEVLGVTYCPDSVKEIQEAMEGFRQRGAGLILLTGGMSVDPDDVTPTAIRESGAEVVSRGVPMQPGNMLTLALWDGIFLLGVPGASMHAPLTSLDVMLPRLFARWVPTREEIAGWGLGGLYPQRGACGWATLPVEKMTETFRKAKEDRGTVN